MKEDKDIVVLSMGSFGQLIFLVVLIFFIAFIAAPIMACFWGLIGFAVVIIALRSLLKMLPFFLIKWKKFYRKLVEANKMPTNVGKSEYYTQYNHPALRTKKGGVK